LTPNDPYRDRTAQLTSKCCILYIYSTNIDSEYFKHDIYSPLFSLQKCSLFHNSNVFGSCIIHILYTGCAKIKMKSGAKRLDAKWGRFTAYLYQLRRLVFCGASLLTRNYESNFKPHSFTLWIYTPLGVTVILHYFIIFPLWTWYY
jgi:hypothetical protein